MSATKHRLPPLDVFMRYAPRVRGNLMAGYHRKLTTKHRWFVRGWGDHYYCDGDMPADLDVDIFDCNWAPDAWDTQPYRYYRSSAAGLTFAYYTKPDMPPLSEYGYGYSREDVLETRGDAQHFVYFTQGTTYCWWHPNDPTRPLRVIVGGLYTHAYADGTLKQGTFSHMNVVKAVEQAPLVRAIKAMRHKRYRGFYDELIEEVITRFGVHRNAI